jgi:Beta-galactosidase trimerisation domain/Beta-galactosidase
MQNMKHLLFFFLFSLAATTVLGGVLFSDNFSGDSLNADWVAGAGEISLFSNALLIRSGQSNPVVRLKNHKWKNGRITFKLTMRGKSRFNLYVGWSYPRFVRLTLAPYPSGTLTIRAENQNPVSFDTTKKIDFNVPTLFDVTVSGKTVICKLNNIEIGRYEASEPLSGSLAFGGGWNSDFEIRDLKVESISAPKPPVVDRFTRPEIKNGTFYVNGQPTFMLGVNDGSVNYWEFGPFNARPPFAPNDVFTDIMSRKTAAKMGFNSDHVMTYARQVCDPFLDELGLTPKQANLLLGKLVPVRHSERARLRSRIAGLPLIVDFSHLYHYTLKNRPERIRKAGFPSDLQHDGGYMPYVPELPIGRRIYNTYFKGGAEYWLDRGNSNPWIYELFNEVQWYHSKHPLNKKRFAEWLKRKYGTIAALRKVWGNETPADFASVAALSPWSGRAMKADWMIFLGDRFVEIFKEGKAAIQSVDPRRKNVYFDIEISVASLWYEQNGIDYFKLMKVADLFGTEGGMPFGVFRQNGKSYFDDVMNNSKIKVMFYCDLARSFAGGKPIIDQESYVRRTHGKLGVVPTHRSDFPTSLWFKVFHNYSGAFIYNWWQGYRNNGWKTLEDARKTTKTVPPALLNPYAYPFDSLKGFKDFATEIGNLAEVALPYPRVTQEIGILYSLPSVWRQSHAISGTQKFPYQQNCFHWYDAFLRRQLPVAVITEQELIERGPGSFKVIAVPYPSHTFAETPAKLREFAAKGGIVLIGDESLQFDTYGHPLADSKLTGRNIFTIPVRISVKTQMKMLNHALDASGYKAPFRVVAKDSGLLSDLEARVIRRKGIDLYFFCNWNPRIAGEVDFFPAVLPGSHFYVTDAVNRRPVLAPSGKREWNSAEIAAGIPVAIPSQERVLLTVSDVPKKYSDAPAWTFDAIRAYALEKKRKLDASNTALDRELTPVEAKEKAAFDVARKPYPTIVANCFPIDLSRAVTMGFRDEQAGDKTGGWTDQGAMDFREFPSGKFTYAGVPFTILDPAKNGGKSCIVLGGCDIKFLPRESAGIPVGRKAKTLYFLHTGAWAAGTGPFFDYEITYSDGSSATFTVHGREECADWVNCKPISNGTLAWENVIKSNGIAIGAYATRWVNPEPGKTIHSLKVVNSRGKMVPIVLAITGENK